MTFIQLQLPDSFLAEVLVKRGFQYRDADASRTWGARLRVRMRYAMWGATPPLTQEHADLARETVQDFVQDAIQAGAIIRSQKPKPARRK